MTDTDNLKIRRNLNALVEFSRVINSSLDLDFIINNVLLTCMGKFLTTKGLIALKSDGVLRVKSYKGIKEKYLEEFPEIYLNGEFTENPELLCFFEKANLRVIETINSSNECIGILCLGERFDKSEFSHDDREFLRTILYISATAIQNSTVITELNKVNRLLDSRIHRLGSLFELSKEFGVLSESSRVAKLLVYSIIGQFLTSKYAVITFEKEGLRVIESKFPEIQILTVLTSNTGNKFEESLLKDEIALVYPGLIEIGVELIVPMQLQGITKGLILLGKRMSNQDYSLADMEFIYSIGSLAMISLENRRLFKEALEKQRMEEELEIARDIQKNLLPHSIPQYERLEISAFNLSSKQVGGDYYDIIPLDDKSFCFVIADVSGKGVPAALLMANLQAFLKIICKQGMKLSEATALINDLITENTMDGRFITFFWGLMDVENNSLEYVNAGHNPPLLIRDGKIIQCNKGGIILGVMKTTVPYLSEKIELRKDDVLVLFTDGITEAKNKDDEEFSDEKLEQLVINNVDKSSLELVNEIKREVYKFASGTIQSDDITILVIKVK